MHCTKCGRDGVEGHRFCPSCGMRLDYDTLSTKDKFVSKLSATKSGSSNTGGSKPKTSSYTDDGNESDGISATLSISKRTLVLIFRIIVWVLAGVYLIRALRAFTFIFSLFVNFAKHPVYSVLFAGGRLSTFLGRFLMTFVLLVFGFCYDPDRENAEILGVITTMGAVIRSVFAFVAYVLFTVAIAVRWGFMMSFFGTLVDVLFTFVTAAIPVGLTFLLGERPFVGCKNRILGEIKASPKLLIDEIKVFAEKLKENKMTSNPKEEG